MADKKETERPESEPHLRSGEEPKEERKKAARVKWTVRDSVFSFLFRQPEYLRELYLALHPEDIGVREEDIRIMTLENVLTNGEHNDLGFLVRDALIILVEAQTTFSLNLALRLLLYLAETYRRLADERGWDVYSSRALKIPLPELAVIYAGEGGNIPSSIRISDIYDCPKERVKAGVLDAEIKIFRFRGKRDIIDQYVRFCEITTQKEKLFGRSQEAIDAIFHVCLEEGILAPFLRSREKEVRDIMTSLFDETRIQELHDKSVREEGREEGRTEGRAEGREAGKADIIAEMLRDNASMSLIEKYTRTPAEKIAEIARSIGVSPVT